MAAVLTAWLRNTVAKLAYSLLVLSGALVGHILHLPTIKHNDMVVLKKDERAMKHV